MVPVQTTRVVLPGRQARPVSGACFYCGSLAIRRNCPKAPGGAAAASKQCPFECEIRDLYDLLPVGNPDFEGQGPDAGLNGPILELDVDELHSIQVHARRPQETYKVLDRCFECPS